MPQTPDSKTNIEDRLTQSAIGQSDPNAPSTVRLNGYLTKTSGTGVSKFRLHPNAQDRSSYVEFSADAVIELGEAESDGLLAVALKPDAQVREVVGERVTPASFLGGAVSQRLSATTSPALLGSAAHSAAKLGVTTPTNCGPARTHCSTCFPGCGGPFYTRDYACMNWPDY